MYGTILYNREQLSENFLRNIMSVADSCAHLCYSILKSTFLASGGARGTFKRSNESWDLKVLRCDFRFIVPLPLWLIKFEKLKFSETKYKSTVQIVIFWCLQFKCAGKNLVKIGVSVMNHLNAIFYIHLWRGSKTCNGHGTPGKANVQTKIGNRSFISLSSSWAWICPS